MNENPIDDDFLKRFHKSPRPEFARKLYDQLQRGDSMLAQPHYSLNGTKPAIRRAHWDQRLTLVAALFALLLLGAIVLLMNLPRNSRLVPMATSPQIAGVPISGENVADLALLARLGDGFITSVTWSPDGTMLALNGSVGVWIYDPNDLSQPIALLENSDSPFARLLKFSPDSSRIIFSTPEQVEVWDIATQTRVGVPIDTGNIISFDVNANGTLIAAGSYDGRMMVYDVATGAVKTEYTITYAYTPIMDVSFSPDGTSIAFTGTQMPVLILDDPTGAWENISAEPRVRRPEENSEAGITGVSFSPDGNFIAGRIYNSVYVWNLNSDEYMIFSPAQDPSRGGKGGGGDLTFSPDSTRLATVDTTVQVWDIASGTSETLIDGNSENYLGYVAFNPDWTRMALLGFDNILYIRDIQTGENVASTDRFTIQAAYDLAFSPDNLTLASVGSDNALRLWDINEQVLRQSLPISGLPNFGFQQVTYHPDGTLALLSQIGISLLAPQSSEPQTVFEDPLASQSIGLGNTLEYNADHSLLGFINFDNQSLTLLDAQTGELRQRFEMPEGMVARDFAFSPDGQHIAISTSLNPFGNISSTGAVIGGGGGGGGGMLNAEFPIQILNIQTGEVVSTLTDGLDASIMLTYTPDGSRLIAAVLASDVRVWDISSGQIIARMETGNSVNELALSPDGTLLMISVYDPVLMMHSLHVWDMTGDFSTPLALLADPDGTGALRFNAAGTLLAGASSNGIIKIWGIE